MERRRKGRIVVLHLAARFPFAGILWQLLHHLVGLRQLGFDVYYLEDHGAWTYDPISQTPVANPDSNVRSLVAALERFGFADRWAFYDCERNEYLGLSRARCYELLVEADAVINLCAATELRDEHRRSRCLIYVQTDPGILQVQLAHGDVAVVDDVSAHHLHFTYALNIDESDCLLPAGGITWRRARPPVLLDQWRYIAPLRADDYFTTVCTWRNKGKDIELGSETYFWSKDVTFRRFLNVANLADQTIELATDLTTGGDFDQAIAGGFAVVPALPMSLDLDQYRRYVAASRGEFTASKDVVVRTRSGWFSDRSVCYLAAGRPVVTQTTGFEKYLPADKGLIAFATADEAVAAIRAINRDYRSHSRAAFAIAAEYFAAPKVLGEITSAAGL